jgi:hypothetical protein
MSSKVHTMRRAVPMVFLLVACAKANDAAPRTGSAAGSYIYVFAGDAAAASDHATMGAHDDSSRATAGTGASDFLAVIDADSTSPTYAKIVASVPIGAAGTMPHHTEMELPAGGRALFANAFMARKTYRFDLSDPFAPRLAGLIDSVPGMHAAHSFSRLPDGNVVGTFQYGDGRAKGDPGGVALFSPEGHVLRTASSNDPAYPDSAIRTYSLDVSPATDRLVTTSTPMDPEGTSADVVQLWRLSDLKLLRTLPFPKTSPDSNSHFPFEVRFFPDGRSAFLNTYYCGFYYLSGLDGDAPKVEPVLALENPKYLGCGVPLLIGTWWIMPIGSTHEYVVFDVSDPRRPRRAGSLMADSTVDAHWISREHGTNRIVASVETSVPSVRIARFDSTSGALTWDESFRETPGGPLGVQFTRSEWPHGKTGPAMPHGAVFSRPAKAER